MTTNQESDIFDVTGRPKQYVGGQKYLQKIEQAVFPSLGDRRCHVVLIKGGGGMGKTRLLEEAMRRLRHSQMVKIYGHPQGEEDWLSRHPGRIIVSNLFDFIDIRLHDSRIFRETLGDRLNWDDPEVTFGGFEAAKLRARRYRQAGLGYSLLEEADKESEKAFWEDYKQIHATRRIVIPLDTAEQLAVLTSNWLVEHDLLTTENRQDTTEQWLVENINAGHFQNSTILLAGRGEEGAAFFRRFESSIDKDLVVLHHVEAEPLDKQEIAEYFRALAQDWEASEKTNKKLVIHTLKQLLGDDDKLTVFQMYTTGQPVRLAIYTDLLIEGNTVPVPLNDTSQKAKLRIAQYGLDAIRGEIEHEFVRLLFRRPALRAQILQLLVRATRGLTARQIHYILYSQPHDDPSVWDMAIAQNETKRKELREVEEELQRMTELAIFKYKERVGSLPVHEDPLIEQLPREARYGLQDEIYRIYHRCVLGDRDTEVSERKSLYETILHWVEPRLDKMEWERRKFTQTQLEDIEVKPAEDVLNSRLPDMTLYQEQARDNVLRQLESLRLEALHYKLLLAPYRNFSYYLDLDLQDNKAGNSGLDSKVFSAEVARTFYEDFVMAFVEIDGQDYETFDTTLDSLRRFFEQYQVAHWIMLLGAQQRYVEAVELAERVEAEIERMRVMDVNSYKSWTRPWIEYERLCWLYRAKIMAGNFDTKQLKPFTEKLEAIAHRRYQEEALPDFKGDPRQVRIVFVLAQLYNLRGFAKTQQGYFETAVKHYARAEQYLRSQRGLFLDEMANILNNKSRALAEMGQKRSMRICEDGLQIRVEKAILDPIALSYNTFGLIYNLLYRPEEALRNCAQAYAIAREVGNKRTLALVQIELATALRRSLRTYPVGRAGKRIDDTFRQADTSLGRAFEHLSHNGQANVQLLRTLIEWGCLYRDWHKLTPSIYQDMRQNFYRRAIGYLQQAINMGKELEDIRLKLDARINLAWTHYRAGLIVETNRELKEAERVIREQFPKAFFQKGEKPPHASDDENLPHYIFKHLAKIEDLRGRIAFDQCAQLMAQIVQEPSKEKAITLIEQRNQFLREGAHAYAFASTYAEVFSTSSSELTRVYDSLYDYLKHLNSVEMRLYYEYDKQVRSDYRLMEIRLRDEGDTETFLLDSFGNYYDDPTFGLERVYKGDS